MIAIDTNILVYAHRADSDWHVPANALLKQLAEGQVQWGIPWHCVHEFIAIVTHPRIYGPPSKLRQAIEQVEAWLESPVVQLFGESKVHWALITEQLIRGRVQGPVVHDARVAAICLGQGVTEFWTADRDFSRFPALATRNPLIDTSTH